MAKHHAFATANSAEEIQLFLQSWWSDLYKLPMKHPLLQEYTVEELLYEYTDKREREEAAKVKVEQENDTMDKAKEDEAMKWAEEEEKKELEAQKKWMEQKLREEKESDPTIGEDVSLDFTNT